MNKTYEFLPNHLSQEDTDYYTSMNKGFTATADCLKVTYESGESETYVIFKGNWTPYGMVRDCGDHYIRARYCGYERIDKDTLTVTEYVEDK